MLVADGRRLNAHTGKVSVNQCVAEDGYLSDDLKKINKLRNMFMFKAVHTHLHTSTCGFSIKCL